MLIAITASGCTHDANGPEAYEAPAGFDANVGLWIASGSPPSVFRLTADQLRSNGRVAVTEEVTTSSASLSSRNSLAFDGAGTLWVASADDSLLIAFSAEALATSGFSVASKTISPASRSLSAPAAIAFDRHDRLWVANFESGTIVRFDSRQLALGGAQAPAVTIGGVSQPAALAFDVTGALWVASSDENALVAFSPAQLEASGSPTPHVELLALGTSLSSPSALAFDALGNLWVANVGKGTIAAFAPADLSASGSPAPSIEFSSGTDSFGIPAGLAFDADGSLWVLSGEGTVHRFRQPAAGASGSAEPSATLFVNRHSLFTGLAFWPIPAALPIR